MLKQGKKAQTFLTWKKKINFKIKKKFFKGKC